MCVYPYLFETLFLILWGNIPRMELLDHVVILFLIFLRNHHAVFQSNFTGVRSQDWMFVNVLSTPKILGPNTYF